MDTPNLPGPTPEQHWSRWAAGGCIGLLSAATALGIGHLVAAVLTPAASPLLAVSSAFIDITPEWLKSFAIATFGSDDKVALLVGVALTLAVIAVGIGLLSDRHPRAAAAAIAGIAGIGAIAALLRPNASFVSVVPALAAAAGGVAALLVLHRAWDDRDRVDAHRSQAPGTFAGRRRFLAAAAGIGGLAIFSGGLGLVFTARRAEAAAVGGAGPVPTPVDPASPIPAGAGIDIDGASPFITSNGSFYRVDTALTVPTVTIDDWRLRVHGLVDRELELTYADLLALPTIERDITLTCVSNVVGGPYVGNARWIGVPLGAVLEQAGVQPTADQIVSTSIDGMTIGTPTAVALDGRDSMLAVAMNGEALPAVHGFPVRMIVPGLYGYVSATKWLVDLELTTFDAFDPYWVQRGWSPDGPIRTMSRIDAPKPLAQLTAGPVAIGGVAWAQHVGIDRVEVRIDDGNWQPATLAALDTIDTWRQWTLAWDATPGTHRLSVRAIDSTGVIQTDARREPFPNGATGHHTIVVTVA
jgi:DMSO/TMAO reductase YedYZ molybdopterin-dependent catalytic subunit